MSSRFRGRAAIPVLLASALAVVPAALAVGPAQAAPTAPQLLEQDTWLGAMPLPGAGIFDPPVVEGGWSAFAPIDDNHYWTVSDRGPNGQPNVTVNGAPRVTRTFLSPDFTPTIYKVAVGADGTLSVQARIKLHLKAGAVDPAQAWFAAHPDPSLGEIAGPPNQITGLPQIVTAAQGNASGLPADSGSYKRSAARDEDPFAADGVTELPNDPYGLDTEGIAVDPRDGSFWLGDEYRPSLIHVASDGTLLNRIVPMGVSVPADPADPAKFSGADQSVLPDNDVLPRAWAYRKQNRGMEGATLTPDGKTLFGMLQSSIEAPAGHGDSRTLRLARFDVTDAAHPRLTGEFVYRLDTPTAASGVKQTDISISDIYAIDATHLLVDEHDNVTDVAGAGQKMIYSVDLSDATNIATDASANGNDPHVEADNAAGIVPVAKTPYVNLVQWGYSHDKPEGIGLFPNGDLAVQDDNDFGFAQDNDPADAGPSEAPFKVTASGHTTQLWRFSPSVPPLTPPGDGDGGGDTPGGDHHDQGGDHHDGGDGDHGDDGHGGDDHGGDDHGDDGHGGDDHGGDDHGDDGHGGDDHGGDDHGDDGHGGVDHGQGGPGHPRPHTPKIGFRTRVTSRGQVLKVRAVRLSVRISLPATAKSTVTVRVGKRTVALGHGTQKLKAGTGTISVPLTAAGRRLLRSAHHGMTLSVAVQATAPGHSASTTTGHVTVR